MVIKIASQKMSDVDLNGFTPRMVKDSFSKSNGTQFTRNCGFSIATKAGFIPVAGQEIEVFEDEAETKKLFGGIIVDKDVSDEETAKRDTDAIVTVDVFSDGYNLIVEKRTISLDMKETNAGAVVKKCIQEITSDNISEGTIIDGAYIEELKLTTISVREILDDMADRSGCIWYIDDSRVLHFVDSDTVSYCSESIDPDGTFKDFFGFEVSESIEGYRNKQFVVYEKGTVVVERSDEIQQRMAIEGPNSSGVWGKVYNDNGIVTEEDATKVAYQLLNENGFPGVVTFSSYSDIYIPEELIPVKFPKFGIDDQTHYMIESVSTTVENNKFVREVVALRRDLSKMSTKHEDDDIKFFKTLAKNSAKALSNNQIASVVAEKTMIPIDLKYNPEAISLVSGVDYDFLHSFESSYDSYQMVLFDAQFEMASDCSIQVTLYQDDEEFYSKTFFVKSTLDTINVQFPSEIVPKGSHTIKVRLNANANGSIAIGKLDCNVQQFPSPYVEVASFDLTIETTIADETYSFKSNTYVDGDENGKMVIDWGDGSAIQTYEPAAGEYPTPSHVYSTPGEHQIKILESEACYYYFSEDAKMRSIDSQFPSHFTSPSYGMFGFYALFESCKMKSLPSKLFEHVIQYEENVMYGEFNMSAMLRYCDELVDVPDDFFWFDMNKLIVDIGMTPTELSAWNMFASCSALVNSPSLLFDHIVLASGSVFRMDRMFWLCTKMLESRIQKSDLADYMVNYTEMYLDCNDLQTIESKFLANTGASNDQFTGIWENCGSLMGIPLDILNGNIYITRLSYTFKSCVSVSAYPNGFTDGCSGLNNSNGLNQTFDGCSGMVNDCDDVWNDFPLISNPYTFIGCDNLSNKASIPVGWK